MPQPSRRLASLQPTTTFYKKVFADWTNIPSVCKEDFPLTEFQKSQCDLFWRHVLTRALVAVIPFLLTWIFYRLWSRMVKRTYQRAASRVSRRKVSAIGSVLREEPEDAYSWLHGFRAVRVKMGEQEMTAYLETHSAPGDVVHLYEAGRWFTRSQYVGVKVR